MPLACLSDVCDPNLFDNAIDLASRYGASVGCNYVQILKTPVIQDFQENPRRSGYWTNYILQNLRSQPMSFRDLKVGLSDREAQVLKTALSKLKRRRIISVVDASASNYIYRLN
jgi:hypothetical protein